MPPAALARLLLRPVRFFDDAAEERAYLSSAHRNAWLRVAVVIAAALQVLEQSVYGRWRSWDDGRPPLTFWIELVAIVVPSFAILASLPPILARLRRVAPNAEFLRTDGARCFEAAQVALVFFIQFFDRVVFVLRMIHIRTKHGHIKYVSRYQSLSMVVLLIAPSPPRFFPLALIIVAVVAAEALSIWLRRSGTTQVTVIPAVVIEVQTLLTDLAAIVMLFLWDAARRRTFRQMHLTARRVAAVAKVSTALHCLITGSTAPLPLDHQKAASDAAFAASTTSNMTPSSRLGGLGNVFNASSSLVGLASSGLSPSDTNTNNNATQRERERAAAAKSATWGDGAWATGAGANSSSTSPTAHEGTAGARYRVARRRGFHDGDDRDSAQPSVAMDPLAVDDAPSASASATASPGPGSALRPPASPLTEFGRLTVPEASATQSATGAVVLVTSSGLDGASLTPPETALATAYALDCVGVAAAAAGIRPALAKPLIDGSVAIVIAPLDAADETEDGPTQSHAEAVNAAIATDPPLAAALLARAVLRAAASVCEALGHNDTATAPAELRDGSHASQEDDLRTGATAVAAASVGVLEFAAVVTAGAVEVALPGPDEPAGAAAIAGDAFARALAIAAVGAPGGATLLSEEVRAAVAADFAATHLRSYLAPGAWSRRVGLHVRGQPWTARMQRAEERLKRFIDASVRAAMADVSPSSDTLSTDELGAAAGGYWSPLRPAGDPRSTSNSFNGGTSSTSGAGSLVAGSPATDALATVPVSSPAPPQQQRPHVTVLSPHEPSLAASVAVEAATAAPTDAVEAMITNAPPPFSFRFPFGYLFDDDEVERDFRHEEHSGAGRFVVPALLAFVVVVAPILLSLDVPLHPVNYIFWAAAIVCAVVSGILGRANPPGPIRLTAQVIVGCWLPLGCLKGVCYFNHGSHRYCSMYFGYYQTVLAAHTSVLVTPSWLPWWITIALWAIFNAEQSVVMHENRVVPAYFSAVQIAAVCFTVGASVYGLKLRERTGFAAAAAARRAVEEWAAIRARLERRLALLTWPGVAAEACDAAARGSAAAVAARGPPPARRVVVGVLEPAHSHRSDGDGDIDDDGGEIHTDTGASTLRSAALRAAAAPALDGLDAAVLVSGPRVHVLVELHGNDANFPKRRKRVARAVLAALEAGRAAAPRQFAAPTAEASVSGGGDDAPGTAAAPRASAGLVRGPLTGGARFAVAAPGYHAS